MHSPPAFFGDLPRSTQSVKDRSLMDRAQEVAKQSDDPKALVNPKSGVGAVLVRDGSILAASANRLPEPIRTLHSITDPNSDDRYTFIEHAERSVIFAAIVAGVDLRGTTLYCTRFPCSDCARAIMSVGIRRLVVADGITGEGRWQYSQRSALKMLRMADVTIRYLRGASSDPKKQWREIES